MLESNRGSGFSITFDNGVRVSVQFGAGSYSSNRNMRRNRGIIDSDNAEIAIIAKNGEWLTRDYDKSLGDDVKGYCKADEVLKALIWAANYK